MYVKQINMSTTHPQMLRCEHPTYKSLESENHKSQLLL